MGLPDLRKTKLSTVSTFGVVFILGIAMAIIAIVAVAAIRGAGSYSLKTTKDAIKTESVKLLEENTRRKSEEYSNYFQEGLIYAKLLGDLALISFNEKDRYNVPDDVIDSYARNFYRSDKKMPFVYYDKNNNTLAAYSGTNFKGNLLDIYAFSLVFPLFNQIKESNSGYYQTWYYDYSLYLQGNCGMNIHKTVIPTAEEYRKVIKKSYSYFNKYLGYYLTDPYKDTYGPMVITAQYDYPDINGHKLVGGVDFLFDKIVTDILKHPIPFIKTNEAQNKKNTSNSFIISRGSSSIIAISQGLYDKFKLPEKNVTKLKLFSFFDVKLQESKLISIRSLGNLIKNKANGIVDIKIMSKEYLICYHKMSVKDWVFGVAVPVKDLYQAVYETGARMGVTITGFIVNFLMVVIFFMFILLIVVFLFFKTYLVKPIVSFRNNVLKMGHGDLDTPIKEKGVFEIAVLANSFNNLRIDLKKYMENFRVETFQRQRRENELKTARQVQLSVLPKITSLFQDRGIELYAKLLPAIDVAGDYYDFFFVEKNKLVLIIADVSGKGISASFFMAVTKRTLRNSCINEPDEPAKAISLANKILCGYDINMFVTLFLVYYDLDTGEIRYANGGHNEAVCLKENGSVDVFGCLNNAALGCFPELPFVESNYKLEVGDTLYLYTDGIVEANAGDENFYGMERFTELLVENKDKPLGKICRKVMQSVHQFENGGQFDDITIWAVKRKK
jgi:serine phosphatase RsbU (regulator of sigma subunit)